MKQRALLFLLLGLLVLCLAAAAQAEEKEGTEAPVEAADPNAMEIVASPYDKKEKTVTVEVHAPEDKPVTIRYGSIGGQAWLLVVGDPIGSSERKLNLVGSTPLLAIHKDDAAKLMTGQPLEEAMTLYAKKSRLPKGSEDAYLYVWLIGTRIARSLETEETLPWSDSENAVPLLVDIKNFDHKHDQQDKGRVTLGKGSVVINDSQLDASEENPFIMRENGPFLVLASDADGNSAFAVVNVGSYTKPVSSGNRRDEGDEEDTDPPPPEDWMIDFVRPELPNDGWGW